VGSFSIHVMDNMPTPSIETAFRADVAA